MDLSSAFQSQFYQLVARAKQKVIADVHRSIDEQASALYQLFLAEVEARILKKSGKGSIYPLYGMIFSFWFIKN